MKGSNKQFAKYLDFECHDKYLQPTLPKQDLSNFLALQNKKLDACTQPRKPLANKKSKDSEQKDTEDSIKKLVPISGVIINDLVARLGQDAQDCVSHIVEAHVVDDLRVLKAFKGFSDHYDTLPAIFFSYKPLEAVYLWQINKLCPVSGTSSHMLIDTAAKMAQTSPNISLLLLAKIASTESEEILSIKLFDDNQLLVKFRSSENELVFKLYNIENFVETARINPFNHNVIANDFYSFKLVLKGWKNPDKPEYALGISLWQTRGPKEEDILIQSVILEQYPVILSANRSEFFDVIRTSQSVIVIVDIDTSTTIAWKENTFSSLIYDIGTVKWIRQRTNSILLSTRDDCLINYELDFWSFPDIKIHKTSSPVTTEIMNLITEFNLKNVGSKKLLVHSLDPKNKDFLKMSFLAPNVPFTLVNPGLAKYNAPVSITTPSRQDVTEEKVEESLVNKIHKMKSKLAYSDDKEKCLEEMLKEIRGNISGRMKEMIEYETFVKEYTAEMRRRHYRTYWNKEMPKPVEKPEPEGVTQEILNLYKEIKTEKTRMRRDRENNKSKRDKGKMNVVRQAI